MQSLNLSIADLLGRPGEYRDFEISRTLSGIQTPVAELGSTPVRGTMRAESVVEGILVTGTVTGSAVVRCARCLEETEAALALDVCELFVTPGHELAEGEEAYRISGQEIHLEPMLRDAVALDLPFKPVCSADCKGLCAHCGRNLNESQCGCAEDETDPRWAELEALRERLQS